jgi:hypothetical protein
MGRILFVLPCVAAFCSLAYCSLPEYDMRLTARAWAPRSGSLLHEQTPELNSPQKATAPTFAVSNDASQIAGLSQEGVHPERIFASSGTPENVNDPSAPTHPERVDEGARFTAESS